MYICFEEEHIHFDEKIAIMSVDIIALMLIILIKITIVYSFKISSGYELGHDEISAVKEWLANVHI